MLESRVQAKNFLLSGSKNGKQTDNVLDTSFPVRFRIIRDLQEKISIDDKKETDATGTNAGCISEAQLNLKKFLQLHSRSYAGAKVPVSPPRNHVRANKKLVSVPESYRRALKSLDVTKEDVSQPTHNLSSLLNLKKKNLEADSPTIQSPQHSMVEPKSARKLRLLSQRNGKGFHESMEEYLVAKARASSMKEVRSIDRTLSETFSKSKSFNKWQISKNNSVLIPEDESTHRQQNNTSPYLSDLRLTSAAPQKDRTLLKLHELSLRESQQVSATRTQRVKMPKPLFLRPPELNEPRFDMLDPTHTPFEELDREDDAEVFRAFMQKQHEAKNTGYKQRIAKIVGNYNSFGIRVPKPIPKYLAPTVEARLKEEAEKGDEEREAELRIYREKVELGRMLERQDHYLRKGAKEVLRKKVKKITPQILSGRLQRLVSGVYYDNLPNQTRKIIDPILQDDAIEAADTKILHKRIDVKHSYPEKKSQTISEDPLRSRRSTFLGTSKLRDFHGANSRRSLIKGPSRVKVATNLETYHGTPVPILLTSEYFKEVFMPTMKSTPSTQTNQVPYGRPSISVQPPETPLHSYRRLARSSSRHTQSNMKGGLHDDESSLHSEDYRENSRMTKRTSRERETSGFLPKPKKEQWTGVHATQAIPDFNQELSHSQHQKIQKQILEEAEARMMQEY